MERNEILWRAEDEEEPEADELEDEDADELGDDEDYEDEDGEEPADGESVPGDGEIGRASCRERV